MHNLYKDWKTVADSYFEKALSLAILIVLFAFLVSPKLTMKAYERPAEIETEAFEIPPDIKEPPKPPEQVREPKIELLINEDIDDDIDDDIPIVATIASTTFKAFEDAPAPVRGKTDPFQVYDDPPEYISQVRPKYPDRARKLGIEGDVVLEVEVFADGNVGDVRVIKSLFPTLDAEAVKAVRQWKFSPAKNGGVAVPVFVTFPVAFSLEN